MHMGILDGSRVCDSRHGPAHLPLRNCEGSGVRDSIQYSLEPQYFVADVNLIAEVALMMQGYGQV